MYQNKKVGGRSGCATLLYHRAAKCCSAPVQCLWQPGSAGPLRPHELSSSPSVLQPSGVCVREHLCHDPVWSNLPYPCTMQQQHVKKLYWGKQHLFDTIMNCNASFFKIIKMSSNILTRSKQLQILWGQGKIELHIQSDTPPAHSNALCFEECYSLRFRHGPAFQSLHLPMRTPVLKNI